MLYLGIFSRLSDICFLPWWLLAMLLPLLLGLLIGYLLWARYKKLFADADKERIEFKAKFEEEHNQVTGLKTEINGFKYQINELERENLSLKNGLHAAEEKLKDLEAGGGDGIIVSSGGGDTGSSTEESGEVEIVATGETEETATSDIDFAYGTVFNDNDLRLIEGVDPGVESILRGAGINTFADLAGKTPQELDALFKLAGPAYEGIDSGNLIQQARLANAGRWDDLILLQKAIGDDDVAKAQLYYAARANKDLEFSDYGTYLLPETLQMIEGVGAKTETTFKSAGINTVGDVAAKTPEELKEILLAKSKGFRTADTKSWPTQAALARDGKWKELVEYQKFLDAGRETTGDFDTPSKASMLVAKLKGGSQVFATPKRDETGIDYATVFDADNLQIIEGIGPKMESVLKEAGIATWADLGAKETDEIQAILDAQGGRYRMMNPESWTRQAKLAAEGKWNELITYQKFLDGGREGTGDFETDSKLQKMGLKILGFSNNPEDLKIIEGIGPKIEELLKAAGINTWAELGEASVDRLKEILTAAGDRFKLANPGSWPRQAKLAAEGNWGELKEYQDYLDGGKDPNLS